MRRFLFKLEPLQANLEGFQVDLNELTSELLRVVQEAMQPEHQSLWLKDQWLGKEVLIELERN